MSVRLVISNPPKPAPLLPAEVVLRFWMAQGAWWFMFWRGRR